MKSFDAALDFGRYLEAKQSIDDRALDVSTMMALADGVATFSGQVLRVLEVGSGVGNMLPRLLRRGVFEGKFDIDYRGIDIDSDLAGRAEGRVEEWAMAQGFDFSKTADSGCVLKAQGRTITLHFDCASLESWSAKPEAQEAYDLVIAQAVLDILDAPVAVEQVLRMLPMGGFYYFPIHFDGNTIFEPVFDAALDAEIERRYHMSMDNRVISGRASGDSRMGRHLFEILRKAGADVRSSGGSSWVVHGTNGDYPEDEAYFLHYIVDGVYGELAGCAELSQPFLWQWAGVRHAEIEEGRLVYIAHQLDFFGTRAIGKA